MKHKQIIEQYQLKESEHAKTIPETIEELSSTTRPMYTSTVLELGTPILNHVTAGRATYSSRNGGMAQLYSSAEVTSFREELFTAGVGTEMMVSFIDVT
jgi:hypothetical protein